MPKLVFDRSPNTQDFEMLDLRDIQGLEIIVSPQGKVWINLNGKCLLRCTYVSNLTIQDARKDTNV